MKNQKPLISHEIPVALFNQHFSINDYPYLLTHLLHKDSKHYDGSYAVFYREIVKEYEYSILDNSAFELGDSVGADMLYSVGENYKPSHLILPDKLHNMQETLYRCDCYIKEFGNVSTPKFIGVLQGNTMDELYQLYEHYLNEPKIDVVAIPYDIFKGEDKLHRVNVVEDLIIHFYGDPRFKKLHLLGCATPQEFCYYQRENHKFIKSIDTSAPIMYGWEGVKFSNEDLVPLSLTKPTKKLAENLHMTLSTREKKVIGDNVRLFRSFAFNISLI